MDADLNQIINTLAWPVVVLVIVLVFRKPLSALLTKATKFKYKDLELEFQEGIERIKEEEHHTLEDTQEPKSGAVEVDLFDMASVSPSAAVMEAWRSVEGSAKDLINRHGHTPDYSVETPYKLMQDILIKGEIIEEKRGKVFDELRQLRNKVTHAETFQVNSDQAVEYVRLALKMKNYLDTTQ